MENLSQVDQLKTELSKLLTGGNVGNYTHCKIDQIILSDTSNKIDYNFFTHIEFSSGYTTKSESTWLNKKAIKNK